MSVSDLKGLVFLGQPPHWKIRGTAFWAGQRLGLFTATIPGLGAPQVIRVADIVPEDPGALPLLRAQCLVLSCVGLAQDGGPPPKPVEVCNVSVQLGQDKLARWGLRRPDYPELAPPTSLDEVRRLVGEVGGAILGLVPADSLDCAECQFQADGNLSRMPANSNGPPLVHGHLSPHNVRWDPANKRVVVVDAGLWQCWPLTNLQDRSSVQRDCEYWLAPELRAMESVHLGLIGPQCDTWGLAKLALYWLSAVPGFPAIDHHLLVTDERTAVAQVPWREEWRQFWSAAVSPQREVRPRLWEFIHKLHCVAGWEQRCQECGHLFSTFLARCPRCQAVEIGGCPEVTTGLLLVPQLLAGVRETTVRVHVPGKALHSYLAQDSHPKVFEIFPATPVGIVAKPIRLRVLPRPQVRLPAPEVVEWFIADDGKTICRCDVAVLASEFRVIGGSLVCAWGETKDGAPTKSWTAGELLGDGQGPDGPLFRAGDTHRFVWRGDDPPSWLTASDGTLSRLRVRLELVLRGRSPTTPVMCEGEAVVARKGPLRSLNEADAAGRIQVPAVMKLPVECDLVFAFDGDGQVEFDGATLDPLSPVTPRLSFAALPFTPIKSVAMTGSPLRLRLRSAAPAPAGSKVYRENYQLRLKTRWQYCPNLPAKPEEHAFDLSIEVSAPAAYRGVCAVDHGATNTCVCADPGSGAVQAEPDDYPRSKTFRDHSVPEFLSVISYQVQAPPVLGLPAIGQLELLDRFTFRSMKPFLGTRRPVAWVPGKSADDEQPRTAVEVVADYYCQLLRSLSGPGELGQPPATLVLTHPVRLGIPQRRDFSTIKQRIRETFRGSGLRGAPAPVILDIDEASAVALFYAQQKQDAQAPVRQLVIVLDVGGSTSDMGAVSVVCEGGHSYLEVLARDGLAVGGNNVTALLMIEVVRRMLQGNAERNRFLVIDPTGLANGYAAFGKGVPVVAPDDPQVRRPDARLTAKANGQMLFTYCDKLKVGMIGSSGSAPDALAKFTAVDRNSFLFRPVSGGGQGLPFDKFEEAAREISFPLLTRPLGPELADLRTRLNNLIQRGGQQSSGRGTLVLSGHSACFPAVHDLAAAAAKVAGITMDCLGHAVAKKAVAWGAHIYGHSHGVAHGSPITLKRAEEVLTFPIGIRGQQGPRAFFATWLPAAARLIPAEESRRLATCSVVDFRQPSRPAAQGDVRAVFFGHLEHMPPSLMVYENWEPQNHDLGPHVHELGDINVPADVQGRDCDYAVWVDLEWQVWFRACETVADAPRQLCVYLLESADYEHY